MEGQLEDLLAALLPNLEEEVGSVILLDLRTVDLEKEGCVEHAFVVGTG